MKDVVEKTNTIGCIKKTLIKRGLDENVIGEIFFLSEVVSYTLYNNCLVYKKIVHGICNGTKKDNIKI